VTRRRSGRSRLAASAATAGLALTAASRPYHEVGSAITNACAVLAARPRLLPHGRHGRPSVLPASPPCRSPASLSARRRRVICLSTPPGEIR
jgi:hypothetical protein